MIYLYMLLRLYWEMMQMHVRVPGISAIND
jgi:hypothetical protein